MLSCHLSASSLEHAARGKRSCGEQGPELEAVTAPCHGANRGSGDAPDGRGFPHCILQSGSEALKSGARGAEKGAS